MVVDEASEEANVLFVAIHKVSPVVDLSQSDIVVRDDNKAPAAILGFRPDQISKICQRKVESSASPQDRKFRFLKPGWGSARGKGWRLNLLPLAIAIEARGLAGENLSPLPRLVDREVGDSFLPSVAGRPDVAVSLALSPPPISPQ